MAVAFVGGWINRVTAPEAVFAGAAPASTAVTCFTFLASFIFILAGGPAIEATDGRHGGLGFTAPSLASRALGRSQPSR